MELNKIREMSEAELNAELMKMKKDLFNLRFQHVTGQLENPVLLRETRRDIARSANTGISAIINQRGDIISPTAWWTECAIKGRLYPNTEITPFVRYGDIAGLLCCWFSAIFLVAGIFVRRRKLS